MINQDEFLASPMVSIILATYNRGNMLSRAIEGVLRQTYMDFEFIIVDDGSTDNTAAVVGQYSDPRIIYKPVEHGERARARNIGIQISRGKYISFLDSDDWYLPEKLAEQVKVLEENPEAGMTLGGWQIVNENGQVMHEDHPWENLSPHLTAEDWLFRGTANPNTILFRRDWFVRVGGFDTDLITVEDTDLWIRLTLAGCENVWTKKNVAVVLAHSSNSLRNWPVVRKSRLDFFEKLFTRPEFVANLSLSKEQIYAKLHLMLAWLAYESGLAEEGKKELADAVRLDPSLASHGGESLEKSMVDFSFYYLVADPAAFIKKVMSALPDSLQQVEKKRRDILGTVYMGAAWRMNRKEEIPLIRKNIVYALYYRPAYLLNRGVWSLFLKTWIGSMGRQVSPNSALARVQE